jgi:hypothetical protein
MLGMSLSGSRGPEHNAKRSNGDAQIFLAVDSVLLVAGNEAFIGTKGAKDIG